ncbi:uncharacterized protein LOC129592068 [Paramacrobiotus metropolitanus]|uniref:uncharacterized protein LOC129592068 n=1 Tax=Paramacrobiotus metropolitanus TaxID=2943436 RepID=UPI0024462BF4|nr:uncharacterized protein LOC129592068 [Paramacrobiotus metropolitanus]
MSVTLNAEQLTQVLPTLRSFHPKSLQIEAMVRNHLSGICAWPGVEFVADQFPDYRVIICRVIKNSKEFVGRASVPGITLLSKDDAVLAEMLADCVDWSTELIFVGIPKTICPIVERIGAVKGTISENHDDAYCVAFTLDPAEMILRPLPAGFVLGELSEHHAEQLCSEWKYGSAAMLPYFQFLLCSNFPSAAVFEEGSDVPVAYVIYSLGDGSLGTGYVHEKYRGNGLFHIVCYHAALKIRNIGQEIVWVYVEKANQSSLNAFRKMGAKMVDPREWSIDWMMYAPKFCDEDSKDIVTS